LAKPVFPFSAIVGQEKAKMSLLLNAVDPRLGGVLITGPKGSGKSTVVRAFGEILPPIERVKGCQFNCNTRETINLCPSCKGRLAEMGKLPVEEVQMRIVELPLSATEDGLLGTLDVEEALREGVKALRPGLLAEANQNILYVDEVNLLPDYLVNCILDPAASGWNVVQREGLSLTHPARFTLVASMNPEEGDLRPQILDRFALSTRMEGLTDPKERVEIVRRNLAFEEDPTAFRKTYEHEQELLQGRISKARDILPRVKVREEILRAVSKTTAELRVDGFRPDLAVVKASRALAAFEGREDVEPKDVLRVSELALGHRTRGGGQEPAERRSIEESLKNTLFREMPPKELEGEMKAIPVPGELGNIVPPTSSAFRRRRRQREIPLLLSYAILAGLMVVFLFFLSVSVLVFRALLFGMPPGGIAEAVSPDQIILTMGFSALALAALALLFPSRTRRPAVFFYKAFGRGFQRRIVQVQRARYPEEMEGDERREREAQTKSKFDRVLNIPLYATIGRLYKLVLDRGPKLPGKGGKEDEERRYRFSLERRRERRTKGTVGRHAKTEARSERGRYVSYEFPRRKPWDMALGPTLRAAATHQALRQPGKLRLKVKVEDVRVKVREMRAPLTIVLLLDMSESMGVSLPNIRNAVLSMHDIAYKKHDRVGLVIFKGSGATTLQSPTANLNLIVTRLKDVGASDLTPLATGMFQSWRLLRNERVKNKDIVPILAIISDGIANIPLSSPLSPFTRSRFLNHAQADVVDAAFLLQREGVQTLVINPSHVPVGASHFSLYKAEILGKTGKMWFEPTELLMQIPIITGGYYYGIGEGGELESVNLSRAFGVFSG
jgi:Mg-chelatase subunit ChlI/Mg-chelatase subunit ChlD